MPSITAVIQQANDAKAEFDDVYDQPDPREYFAVLRSCGYQIPERAKPTFYRVFDNLRRMRNREELSVVDVGCSYGVNAALLRYDLSLDSLYRRYADPEFRQLSSRILEQKDREFFSRLPQAQSLHITGLDIANRAVRYAESVSLLDSGIACNLESDSFDPPRLTTLGETDVVISTGCVGYVTGLTFSRILESTTGPRKPWVASFVLRMFPYDGIAETCSDHGLVTYKLTGQTFVQRRFADHEERAGVRAELLDRDLPVTGLEDTGYLHAEFFLSIPTPDAHEMDLRTPWKVTAAP